uniref:Uncharacterized protein n=1 Tax=Anguilla anguilla TaxID=7936 RepID=A0A0E9VDT5_ANGAN
MSHEDPVTVSMG